MKPCVIKQPAGIGDIFFCQKIARYMAHHGYQIIWPLKPEIAWIGDYIKGILFCTTEDEFPMKDIYDQATGYVIEDAGAFISTATADKTHNDSRIMSSKYTMLGMDYSDWAKYFIFEHFFDKKGIIFNLEDSLISSVFALKVTPKKQIFLFFNLLFNILDILFNKIFDLFSFDLITLLITDKFV